MRSRRQRRQAVPLQDPFLSMRRVREGAGWNEDARGNRLWGAIGRGSMDSCLHNTVRPPSSACFRFPSRHASCGGACSQEHPTPRVGGGTRSPFSGVQQSGLEPPIMQRGSGSPAHRPLAEASSGISRTCSSRPRLSSASGSSQTNQPIWESIANRRRRRRTEVRLADGHRPIPRQPPPKVDDERSIALTRLDQTSTRRTNHTRPGRGYGDGVLTWKEGRRRRPDDQATERSRAARHSPTSHGKHHRTTRGKERHGDTPADK